MITFFVYFGYIKDIFGSDDNDIFILSSNLQVLNKSYDYFN